MDRKGLEMILKEGEGYKIEFKEGFNSLVEKGLFVKEGSTAGLKFRLTSVNSGQLWSKRGRNDNWKRYRVYSIEIKANDG